MLELATYYNAGQLVSTCQQFIGLNLAALLESSALDCLSEETHVNLTQFYRNFVGLLVKMLRVKENSLFYVSLYYFRFLACTSVL